MAVRVMLALRAGARRGMAVYAVQTPPRAKTTLPLPSKVGQDAVLREQVAFAARISEPTLSPAVLSNVFSQSEAPRMAVMGSAVIRLCVSEYLVLRHPALPANAVKAAVNRFMADDTLASLASRLGAQHSIQPALAQDEAKHVQQRALADTFSAVVAAIHVESGFKSARAFCRDFVLHSFERVDVSEFVKLEYPKAMLQHILKEAGRPPLKSAVIEQTGVKTHIPTIVVGVYSGDDLLGEAAHFSKTRAEAEACRAVLIEHYSQMLADAPLPTELDDYQPEAEVASAATAAKK